jgi:single-strand DNA-binding protein
MSTVLVGNLVSNPELKFTETGVEYAVFSIAVTKVKGEEKYTSFFECSAWGSLGKNLSGLDKGTRVLLSGEFNQRSYEDKDGKKRSAVEFKAFAGGPELTWAHASVTKND